jgi:hypothetical protein
MTPITDDAGNIVGYYDDNFLAYNANGDPIMANGAQAIWDPNNNVLIDASAIPNTVDPAAPPAGVASSDWVSLFTDAIPKVITGIQAYQLSQINVKRAAAGLAPLNSALYAPGQAGFLANMSSTSMLLIAGLAAVFLIGGKK